MVRWSKLRAAERWLNLLVIASVLLPLVLVGYALAASFVFDPEAVARGEHLSLVGLSLAPCPGCAFCGMSRAFSALAHGDVAGAVSRNAGVVVTFPSFCALALVCMFGLYRFAREPLRLPPPTKEQRAQP